MRSPNDHKRVMEVVDRILSYDPGPGATKRGVPADYAGDDPSLCNARTKSGRPCRSLGLEPNGRCKWHGGLSTGPRTPEDKATTAGNFSWEKEKLKRQVVRQLQKTGYLPERPFATDSPPTRK